jgi:N-acetyl-gamma-glutamyl-phosphate reductase
MVRVGIYGATGYTGYELVKLLAGHAGTEVVFATSRSSAGKRMSDLYPCPYDLTLITPEDAELDGIDVAFFCLPHGESMAVVEQVRAASVRAIDLSADFRLRDVTVYEQWYKVKHVAPGLLSRAIYGLPEVYREQIVTADLIANPGCYPTGVLLALHPLVCGGYLGDGRIIADSKSGVSGSGRKLSQGSLFCEVNEDFRPYNVGRVHRHLPEMEQELVAWSKGPDIRLTFVPHLLPVNRGILSTIYVTLAPGWSVQRLVDLYRDRYAGEPFIHVLAPGRLASLAYVAHTNRCALSFAEAGEDAFIIVSAIDNLIKGASGQAVQAMNLMFGLDEAMGLPQ